MYHIRTFCIIVSALALACASFSCSSSKTEEMLSADQRFRSGMEEYNNGDYFDAIQHFEVIRLQFAGTPVSDSARYFGGMCRYRREEFLLASYDFSQMIQNHPASKLVPDAQFMYAECFYELSPKYPLDQSFTTRAIDALQTFVELFPTHARVSDAERQIKELSDKLAEKEFKTGLLYVKLESYSSALIYFDTVIDKYYTTDYIDDALVEKLRILMRRKQYDAADPLITSFLDKYSGSPFIPEVVRMRETIDAARGMSGTQTKPDKK